MGIGSGICQNHDGGRQTAEANNMQLRHMKMSAGNFGDGFMELIPRAFTTIISSDGRYMPGSYEKELQEDVEDWLAGKDLWIRTFLGNFN